MCKKKIILNFLLKNIKKKFIFWLLPNTTTIIYKLWSFPNTVTVRKLKKLVFSNQKFYIKEFLEYNKKILKYLIIFYS